MEERFKTLKLNLVLKLWFFNTYTFGFVLNFIAFLNSNWLRNDFHTYGLFEFCELEIKDNQNQGYLKQILACNLWSSDTKPS